MSIGERIKKIRKDNKKTQAQFANELGISRSAVILYEKGERIPPTEVFLKIANKYNISMDNLLNINNSISYDEANRIAESGTIEDFHISAKDSKEKTFDMFKCFLKSNGFPIEIIKEEELEVLYKKTFNYIEFELFQLGYIKITEEE